MSFLGLTYRWHRPIESWTLVLGLVLVLNPFFGFAQLSGTYVIGSSGTADYANFGAAVIDLQAQGLSGDVRFEIENGTYTEQVELLGTSINNSGTFSITMTGQNQDSSSVILTFGSNTAGSNHTLDLEDISNVTFSYMTIENTTPGSLHKVIDLVDASDILITRSRVVAPTANTNGDDQAGISVIDNSDNVELSFSRIENGSSGISLNNSDGPFIHHNEFYNQYFNGITTNITSEPVIQNNYIENNDLSGPLYTGVYLLTTNDFIVSENRVKVGSGTSGLFFQFNVLINNAVNLVANNHIHVVSSGASKGIEIFGGTNLGLYHNTVIVDSGSHCLEFLTINDSKVQNNIFQNQGTGFVYGGTLDPSQVTMTNNVLYSISGITQDDFSFSDHVANTGLDSASSFHELSFTDADFPNVCHYAVNGAGAALDTAIGTDFYGSARNTTAPDIGAYEFDLPTTVIFDTSLIQICLGDTAVLQPVNSFVSYFWLSDSSTNSSFLATESGDYGLEVVDTDNCTLFDEVVVDAQETEADLGDDREICVGNPFTLSLSEPYVKYNWSTGDTTETIEVTDAGTYWVQVVDDLGCQSGDTVVLDSAADSFKANFLVSDVGCTSDTMAFVEVSELVPESVLWDFGDGNTSTDNQATHMYSAVGDYVVTMTAVSGSCTVSISKPVVITSLCPDFLKAYYPLDTGANDISDNAFHGTIQGGVSFVSDPERGDVALFNGIDGFIDLTTSSALELVNSSFTISAWVKVLDADSIYPVLGTSVEQVNQGLNLGLDTGGRAKMSFYDNDLTGKQFPTLDEWHFISFSYDVDSGTMSIYLDGEKDATVSGKDAFEGLDIVTMGLAQNGHYFSGYMDDVRIWKEDLNDEEIFEHWSGYSTELVAHYPLISNGSDISGNGYDGTLNGNITFIQDPVRGLVAQFGGANTDYIRLTRADSLSITESSFVVSAWINVSNFDKGDLGILGSINQQGQRRGLHLVSRQRNPYMGFWAADTRDPNTTLETDNWYHITFLYDKEEKTQTIFVNGQRKVSRVNRNTFLGTQDLLIGNCINFNKGMNGRISDLKIRRIDDELSNGSNFDANSPVVLGPELILFPNPADEWITVSMANSGDYYAAVQIFDRFGKFLFEQSLQGSGDLYESIDLNSLETGMYILKLNLNGEGFSRKFLIR